MASSTGETYKLRASNTRERQVWVDRIRHVGQLFDVALAQNHHSVTSFVKPGTPPVGSKSLLSTNGLPSDALQTLSLSVLVSYPPLPGIGLTLGTFKKTFYSNLGTSATGET